MNKISIFFIFLICVLTNTSTLFSEILEVKVIWNNKFCPEECISLLSQEFNDMKDIEEANLNPSSGFATLKWKPNAKFSFPAVNLVMQKVGVGLNDIRIKVRGTAQGSGDKVIFKSLEDNTPFVLVSPMDYRKLSKQERDGILKESNLNKILVIEGPLYRPGQPPLTLVIERVQVEETVSK